MKLILNIQRLIKQYYVIFIIIFTLLLVLLINHFKTIPTPDLVAVEVSSEENVLQEPIQPIPLAIKLDENKVKLGEKLFSDPRISHDNTFSCASCHNLNKAGTDQLIHPITIKGTVWEINTSTVFNSGFNFKQHWNGESATLEDQMDHVINNPRALASSWEEIVNKLKQSPEYKQVFAQIYSDGITTNNIKNAIATFERSLYTPNSRFDKFLRGNNNAITKEEQTGYEIFKSYGCVSCHQGVNVGGNLFQKFGILGDYFIDRGKITQEDLGRFNSTKDELDRYVFKVPGLRNVDLTPPYFHDGSAKTLEEAVGIMAKYQLGRQIPPEDTKLIIKFLKTLTGEYKGKSL